jgi:hypothetical protein
MFNAPLVYLPFLVTLGIELVVVVLCLVRRASLWEIVSVVLFVNFVTHPLGAVLYYVVGVPLILVELLVVCIEWVAYSYFLPISWRMAFIVSVVANTCSFFLGPLIRAQVG